MKKGIRALAAMLVLLVGFPWTPGAWGASHREAPLIALDPAADITDVYAFRSWDDGSKVVFIMNVIPSQGPASGPNFFNFDDNVLYTFHFDLDGDGRADDAFIEFRFTTDIRSPFDDLPISYGGVDPVPGLPPAITALEYVGRLDRADDVLAWALYRAGRHEEARGAIENALRMGTRDARLFYHAGMIHAALERVDDARTYLRRALALNPHVDLLHAPQAERTLARLESRRP